MKEVFKSLFSEKQRNSIRRISAKLISPIYFGKEFHCNCCNKSFRKFLSKGNVERKNVRCPYCDSLERTRVLDLYLDREINIYEEENISILHFAPEEGLFNKLRKIRNVEYVDADINPAYARTIIDITSIPYPDNYFDYIICSHVLGHVPNEALAIREMHRVLKDSGTALILTLLNNTGGTIEDETARSAKEKLERYGEPDLERLHGNDFEKRLKNGGFKTRVIDYRTRLSKETQHRNCLGNGEREIIFRGEK